MWTTDTFLENLARFSALKGQECERPTAHGRRDGPAAVGTGPRPSGRARGRRDGPAAVGTGPRPSGRARGLRDGHTAVGTGTRPYRLTHGHTEQTGLPYFDRPAATANGNWYYDSALESMGAKLGFRCHSVNIALIYKQ